MLLKLFDAALHQGLTALLWVTGPRQLAVLPVPLGFPALLTTSPSPSRNLLAADEFAPGKQPALEGVHLLKFPTHSMGTQRGYNFQPGALHFLQVYLLLVAAYSCRAYLGFKSRFQLRESVFADAAAYARHRGNFESSCVFF